MSQEYTISPSTGGFNKSDRVYYLADTFKNNVANATWVILDGHTVGPNTTAGQTLVSFASGKLSVAQDCIASIRFAITITPYNIQIAHRVKIKHFDSSDNLISEGTTPFDGGGGRYVSNQGATQPMAMSAGDYIELEGYHQNRTELRNINVQLIGTFFNVG